MELNFVEQNAKNGQSAELYWLLAKIYRNRGDADLALDAYNRAALIEPKNFYIQKDHGLYLEQLGQAKRAEPGTTDYWVHDETGRPLMRIDVTSHDHLTDYVPGIAELLRAAVGKRKILLAFDRAGAFADHLAGSAWRR